METGGRGLADGARGWLVLVLLLVLVLDSTRGER